MALQQQSQSKTKTSMQSQRTSMKTRSGSTPLRCRSSRRACRVNAFLSTTEISRRALCLPSPFTHSNKQLSCPTNLLTEDTVYQGSDWVDLFPEQSKGQQGFDVHLNRWSNAYELRQEKHLVLACEHTNDAFIFFTSELVNTGRFGDLKPTGKRSQVLGLQRVHVGGDGHITDVWLFRSGTQEEMELLLNRTKASPWIQPDSSGPALAIEPCGWSADHMYTATILSNAGIWAQEIMSHGSLSTLARVAAPDMTLIDGTGILHGPLTGVSAIGGCLAEQFARCDIQTRILHSQVVEPSGNKICQHWTQMHNCRTTGLTMERTGATLLIFDSKAQIQQVVEFIGMHNPLLGVFDEAAVARVLACYRDEESDLQSSEGANKARVALERARLEEERLREEAECLARQEREWMSW